MRIEINYTGKEITAYDINSRRGNFDQAPYSGAVNKFLTLIGE